MKVKYIIIILVLIMPLHFIKTKTYKIYQKKYVSNNKILENYGYIEGYTCSKITVLDSNGKYQGKYDLEDYVGRVVSGETHILDDQTTFEAMSVAVRTYALYVTNNCKRSIMNSEAHQVMSNIVSKKIRNAVSKTKGQVLVLNNKLVKAEYDSFYKGAGFYCDRKFCYSKYLKVGNSTITPTSHKIKVPATWLNDLSGGHGKGLSQYGSKYLASIGYTYDQILKYFYADGVVIANINKPNIDGLILENDFISRKTRPLRNNSFYYINGAVSSSTLEGESNWYATSRGNEILRGINSNKKLDYMNIDEYCNINNFSKSYKYDEPKEGAIISWGKHLAVIEKVDNDKVDISEAYAAVGYYGNIYAYEYLNPNGKYYNSKTNVADRKYNCEGNMTGCFKRTNNVSIESLRKRWGYDFKCYIYLVD